MLDLDIGMQDWLTEPFAVGRRRRMDRGKVMSAQELEAGRDFGRYLDVDGDGIPYRTYPGTHATKGSYFTRGTTKDRYARYTEEGPAYVDNMQRLLRKFETREGAGAGARDTAAAQPTRPASSGSARPARRWPSRSRHSSSRASTSTACACAPSRSPTRSPISSPRTTTCSSSSRTATRRLKSLLVNECGIDPAKLISVLHYDGTPITARFITREIGEKARLFNVTPLRIR